MQKKWFKGMGEYPAILYHITKISERGKKKYTSITKEKAGPPLHRRSGMVH